MTRGFRVAGAGLITQTKKIDTLANNIANVTTAGYKKDQLSVEPFGQALMSRQEKSSREAIGNVTYGGVASQQNTVFTQGMTESTDNCSHFAIVGDGFFTIQGNGGDLSYTRNGQFFIDNEGYLSSDGGRVQGTEGDIHVGDSDFLVNQDGTILVNGNEQGRLRIYSPFNINTMRKLENGNYTDTAQTGKEFSGKVVQGSIESSNVEMTQEMMDIMSSQRSYQASSRILQIIDESLQTANEVSKL